ncbi:MAG: hypothetical protein ACP5T2_05925 [Thermoprotei archaeon]
MTARAFETKALKNQMRILEKVLQGRWFADQQGRGEYSGQIIMSLKWRPKPVIVSSRTIEVLSDYEAGYRKQA